MEYFVWSCDKAGTYIGVRLGPGMLPGTSRLRARHLWDWHGALSASQLALTGPTGGKITAEVEVTVKDADVWRLIRCTETAVAALARVPPWTP